MNVTLNSGGRPLTSDRRDFHHSRYFGSTVDMLAQLPREGLGRQVINLNNQGMTSFCTACATSEASAYMEGVPMSFEFQAAKIGQLVGEPIVNGADPRKAMETMVLYGSLPKTAAPFSLEDHDAAFLADYRSWPPPLDLQSGQFEKASYFRADTGPFDAFDNIRVALFQASAAKGVVMAFSQWFQEWNSPPIVGPGKYFVGWHAYLFIDWVQLNGVPHLKAQNSYGPLCGDGGVQYFPREVVNATFAVPGSGCYIFRDVNPRDVKSWNEQQSTLAVIYQEILQRVRYIFGI